MEIHEYDIQKMKKLLDKLQSISEDVYEEMMTTSQPSDDLTEVHKELSIILELVENDYNCPGCGWSVSPVLGNWLCPNSECKHGEEDDEDE